jgi:hypothetical protein
MNIAEAIQLAISTAIRTAQNQTDDPIRPELTRVMVRDRLDKIETQQLYVRFQTESGKYLHIPDLFFEVKS